MGAALTWTPRTAYVARMQRVLSLVAVLAAAAFLVGSVRLARLERSGPAHMDLVLEGGLPATVYLPGDARGPEAFLDPPPLAARPPALVLMHGFAGDRLGMSGLSRRIARSGYAVLAFDAMGHGENRNPYTRSLARADSFQADLATAVDFLRAWPFVDGSRIAVGGHSMGAKASLDFATRDSGLDAVVLLSGSSGLEGPFRPPDALFLVAEGDPERISNRMREVAAELAGRTLAVGSGSGRHDRHDAVRFQVISGADHLSIPWKAETAREVVAWLDAAFGVGHGATDVAPDPRLPLLASMLLAFLLLLPGLGLLVGRLVPEGPDRPAEGRLLGLALLAAALFLTLPLFATGTQGALLGVEVGDVVGVHFGLAGLVVLVALRLGWPAHLEGAFPRHRRSALGAGLALIAVFVLAQPFGSVLHRLTLTPERSAVFVGLALCFLPFSLAACATLRRGGTAGATVAALGARVLVLLVLIVGVRLELLGPAVRFMVAPLAGVSVMIEVLAAAIHASSRNLVAIAVMDAGWLALLVAALMPIRF
jgi:dienelactone hydrolase